MEIINNNYNIDLEKVTDKLGEPIDKGIIEGVAVLNKLGFPTSQSCEGHLDRGYPFPWIEIYPHEPEEENWKENSALREKVIQEENKYKNKFQELIDSYNKEKGFSQSKFKFVDIEYGFRFQTSDNRDTNEMNIKEKEKFLKQTRNNLSDFIEFLKNK